MAWNNPVVQAILWSAATIIAYWLSKRLHARLGQWWSSPAAVTPLVLLVLALMLNETYRDYIRQTHWLLALLGPVTVAFAVPIWEQRGLIRRRWPVLTAAVLAGSSTAMVSAWFLAKLLGLDEGMQLSLLPRSISTPFAITVSGEIGGVPDLTAVFVACTGVFGAALGGGILHILPLRSAMARGALLGMGAHGAGVASAQGIGREEGAIASLIMVLVGLVNVMAAPLLAYLLQLYGGSAL